MIILILSTAMIVFWLFLLNIATNDEWSIAAYNHVLHNIFKINELKQKNKKRLEKLSTYYGIAYIFMKIVLGGDNSKKINKLEVENERVQEGDLRPLSIFPIAGYVLLEKFNFIKQSDIYMRVLKKNFELYGKKRAENTTKHLFARMLSYGLIGLGVIITVGVLFVKLDGLKKGLIFIVMGSIIVLTLTYVLYDELNEKIEKRKKNISRQFPNVVSKLALLVTGGMNMQEAWKEVAYSQSGELYIEMQVTSKELDNLVPPEIAYGTFIDRCNSKETTKLASSIIQSISKGNPRVHQLLKNMAKEAWLERRHMAKRDSEAANTKLMIPTMLLFTSIIMMIIVPMLMNF